jgi:hypothetical protein
MRDERAQASVEYILMMAVVVAFVLLFARKFVRPLFQKLNEAVEDRWKNLFRSEALHRFRM